MTSFATTADQALWGAKRIAAYLGCSEATVYALARHPDSPIYCPSGRYYGMKHELDKWLRTKPNLGNQEMKDLKSRT